MLNDFEPSGSTYLRFVYFFLLFVVFAAPDSPKFGIKQRRARSTITSRSRQIQRDWLICQYGPIGEVDTGGNYWWHVFGHGRLVAMFFRLRENFVHHGVVELLGFFFSRKVKTCVAVLDTI